MKISRLFLFVLWLAACGSDKSDAENAGSTAGLGFEESPVSVGIDGGKGGTSGAAVAIGGATGTATTAIGGGGTGDAAVANGGAGGPGGKGEAAGAMAGGPGVDAAVIDASSHADPTDAGADAAAIAEGGYSTKDDAGPSMLPALPDQTPPLGTNGIGIDETGSLWIADLLSAQIIRINPPPDLKIVGRYGEAQGVTGPDDLVIDGHFVYWTGYFDGVVGKLDRLSGQSSVIANTGAGTNPIAFGNNGMLLVGRTQLGTGLFEVDPAGITAPRTISEEVDSNGFTLAPDGFVYGPSWDTVIKIDPTTGTFETLMDGFVFICSIRYNPRDGYLYVLEALPASMYRVALDGSSKQLFATLSDAYIVDNFAIAKDGAFLVTRFLGPVVTRVSADGAAIEDFTIGE